VGGTDKGKGKIERLGGVNELKKREKERKGTKKKLTPGRCIAKKNQDTMRDKIYKK